MKCFLYLTVLVPTIFGFIVSEGFGSLTTLLLTTYTSVFWMVAAIYLCDFSMAMIGRNSEYMMEFYAGVSTDLFVSLVVGVSLVALYWRAPNSYSFFNIDLAGAGLPFCILGIIGTVRAGQVKVVNNRISKTVISFFVIAQMLSYAVAFYFLSYVISGKATVLESVWIQLTVVFSALTFFFGAKQMQFVLKKQRMELSPVILSIFEGFPHVPFGYREAQIVADAWNKEVNKAKASKRKVGIKRRGQKRK